MDRTGSNKVSKRFAGLNGQELLVLGLDQIAYIKPVTVNGAKVWAVHAANGKTLSIVDSAAKAFASTVYHDLKPVRLH